MLCRVCCTRGEKIRKAAETFPTCAAGLCCFFPGTAPSLGCVLHWMKHQECKGSLYSPVLNHPRDLRKPVLLSSFGFQPLRGKALALLFDSSPPVLLHMVNNQVNNQQHDVLSLSRLILCSHLSSAQQSGTAAAHLSCHCCWPGRNFTASDGGPGAPSKLFFQWWWSWSVLPAQSGIKPHMQWGRKEPLTAHKGPTVHQGEGPAFIWHPEQPSRSSPLPHNCSGTKGQVHKPSPNSIQMKETAIIWLWKSPKS